MDCAAAVMRSRTNVRAAAAHVCSATTTHMCSTAAASMSSAPAMPVLGKSRERTRCK